MKKMKFAIAALLGTLSAGLVSCDDDDTLYYGSLYANALVTVRPNADNSDFYLQLDDTTTLKAVNMKHSPFGTREVRALANLTESDAPAEGYDKAVFVNWIDSLLTKEPVADLGEENAKVYGNDPVEIVRNWVTVAEDGYLTLRFRSSWDPYFGKKHIVNIVASSDPATPYTLTFYHNANGDAGGVIGDGIVAFNLSSLPDTNGKEVDLTLKWNSFSGEKSTTFKYCTRMGAVAPASGMVEGLELNGEGFVEMIE